MEINHSIKPEISGLAKAEITRTHSQRQLAPLLIDPHLDEICLLLCDHQVVVLNASTGLGKTLGLPPAVHEYIDDEKVIVTAPKRILVKEGALGIARRYGLEEGNDFVTYRLRRDDAHYRPDAPIEFRLDQSLLNEIIEHESPYYLPKGVIIVDEAHTNTLINLHLLQLLKERLPHNPETKVILSSATLDAEKWSAFFPGAAVYRAHESLFPVREHFIELGPYEHHSEAAIRCALRLVEQFSEGNLRVGDVAQSSGTLLMLLPGKYDINAALRSVAELGRELGISQNLELLECHSRAHPLDLARMNNDSVQDGVLRVVAGTSIAREGLTIRGIRWVIDSGQVKEDSADHVTGIRGLVKTSITETHRVQALGRLGREHSGEYYRVGVAEERKLQKESRSAVESTIPSSLLLDLAYLGKDVANFDFPDRIPDDVLKLTIQRLQFQGLLNQENKLTDLGRQVRQIEASPEGALALLYGNALGIYNDAAIAVAIIENESPFILHSGRTIDVPEKLYDLADESSAFFRHLRSTDNGDGTYALDLSATNSSRGDAMRVLEDCVRREFARGSHSDFIAGINLVSDYLRQGKHRSEFAQDWMLNQRHLDTLAHQVLNLKAATESIVDGGIVSLPSEGYSREDKVHAVLLKAYFSLLLTERNHFYAGQGKERVNISARSLAYSEVGRPFERATRAPFVLAGLLGSYNSGGTGQTEMNYSAGMAAVIPRRIIADVMGDQCSYAAQPHWRYNNQIDALEQEMLVRYGGHEVERRYERAKLSEISKRRMVDVMFSQFTAAPGELPEALRAALTENREIRERVDLIRRAFGVEFSGAYGDDLEYRDSLKDLMPVTLSYSDLNIDGLRLSHEAALRLVMRSFAK